MEYVSLLGLIFGVHLLAVISPGPDFVMVLKNALQYNRKIALYTAFGISLGIGVHILFCIRYWGLLICCKKIIHCLPESKLPEHYT